VAIIVSQDGRMSIANWDAKSDAVFGLRNAEWWG